MVGVFQLFAALIIPIFLLLNLYHHTTLHFTAYAFTLIFTFLNAVSGYTAYKGIKKYYWLSVFNQSLQLFSGTVGSISLRYSSIGGVFAIIMWGEESGFGFSATINPGLALTIFEQPISIGYFAIDIIAILFVSVILMARHNKSQLTNASTLTAISSR